MRNVGQGTRARFSVDLGDLKAVLMARARATGKAPAVVLREALETALALRSAVDPAGQPGAAHARPGARRVRMSMRMRPQEAQALTLGARWAGLAPGAYVAALVAGVTAAQGATAVGAGLAEHRQALMASSVQLASLARDLRALTRLLSLGEVAAAQAYRVRLDGAAVAIQGHLRAAGEVLAALTRRPPSALAAQVDQSARHRLAGKVSGQRKSERDGRSSGEE